MSWFITKGGRIFTYTAVGLVSASIFTFPMALNGPFLHQYQTVFQSHKKGEPASLEPYLKSLTKAVLKDVDLSPDHKRKFSFFPCVAFDIMHAGGYNSPWGAVIGIPATFSKDSQFALRDLKIVGKEDFDWVIDGMDLLDTLKLTENAKKFAIAREIYSCGIGELIQNSLFATMSFFGPAYTSYFYNKRMGTLVKNQFRKRILVYTGFYLVGLFLYECFKSPLKHLSDAAADHKAANLGQNYLLGGIEFYTQMLEKNKELREIMGKEGESHFNADGNAYYFLFSPKLPITDRLKHLKDLVKE